MITRGRVQNGVVVLDEGTSLLEGQEVSVLVSPPVSSGVKSHSILDIPSISLGSVLHSFTDGDDLLGEMLEGRT
jgi:hypothetical protein